MQIFNRLKSRRDHHIGNIPKNPDSTEKINVEKSPSLRTVARDKDVTKSHRGPFSRADLSITSHRIYHFRS